MTHGHRHGLSVAILLAVCGGCSDDGVDASRDESTERKRGGPVVDEKRSDDVSAACGSGEFDSTFAAIQQVIFEKNNCTNRMCHGAAAMGGLDLRAEAAYESLIEVKATSSSLFRVMPGEPDESFLYNKLRAATEPGSVDVEGSPMPSGAAPLKREHLEAVRKWIEAGAPRTGSIGDSVTGRSDSIAKLLGSCLPEATPVSIGALEAPAAAEGVQLAMAPFTVPGQTELEVCFAQYYDFSDVVPAEFQDRERGVFFVNGQRLRQDPHSHHLVIAHAGLGAEAVHDPSFGKWACHGGDREGTSCDPLERSACGSGMCASEPKPTTACIGFGPAGSASILGSNNIGGAQTAQFYQAPREGIYETMPIKGIVYMNSHAFNLTGEATQLHAWLNLFYAHERDHELEDVTVGTSMVAHGQAPFTKQMYCRTWVAPQGSQLYTLTSHTHKRGRNFTVDLADGTRIYTNARYSDPIVKVFDPPMLFDSTDEKSRTLTYCAEFNNGVMEDGSPDLDLVTRLSTMPDRTTCEPVGCVGGKVGSPCQGAGDGASCDTSPGAGNGWCDACPITGGVTTENEMFFLLPSIVRR
ncbi:MAG TPA: hypothetical protein VJV78_17755 [Polyangiales bacterium]|nr:hypothetical protein [Polyangiales bacterium]